MTERPDPDLLSFLTSFLTPERAQRIASVLAKRTRYITVVLEDLYQAQNISAVMRTCECLGIQDIHIIERDEMLQTYKDITKGSDKWLNITRYKNQEAHSHSRQALSDLKAKGYRIVACGPHVSQHTPENLPLDHKVALCFGAEKTGLSEMVMEQADDHLQIPMSGFTESFNISVAAAMALYTLTQRMRNSDLAWALSDDQSDILRYQWTKQSLRMADELEAQWQKKTRSKYERDLKG